MEINKNRNTSNKLHIVDRISEISKSKKDIHEEVVSMKYQL